MLGFLKRRNKDFDDVEDIRSNVLGNDFKVQEQDFPPPTGRRVADRFPGIEDSVQFEEPPGFGSVDTRFPGRGQDRQNDRQNNYDIMDRLNLIESQLTAIRSQTETINERLKNMEQKLTRRY
ncbi:MAG TPA: hypothetical protein VJH04_04700 [archaeon]|nr:hypothetical protein [archaeon]